MLSLNQRFDSLRSGRRIGLLGGSFNPAHEGHRAMSLYALKRLDLDEIWWLVSPQNPLKPEAGMAPLEDRVKTARIVGRHPNILVTDIERSFGTRYTVDTLRALKRRYPKIHFVWLMGADNLQQVPRWKNWKMLFKMVPIAVFRRLGHKAGRSANIAASRFEYSWHSLRNTKAFALSKPPAWIVLDNPLNLMSATALRQQNATKGKR